MKKSKMIFHKWLKKKPDFDCECFCLCASSFGVSLYTIKRIDFEDGWYWGWCTGDGEEYGDLKDMRAQRYYLIPMINLPFQYLTTK